MRWKREDLAWAAGLIEGEGCIYSSMRSTGVRGGRAVWHLTVQMTDEDVLRRLAAVIGLGNVCGPYKNKGDGKKAYKPIWSWTVSSRTHVYAVLVALWPWLGARRREKVREALAALPPVVRS